MLEWIIILHSKYGVYIRIYRFMVLMHKKYGFLRKNKQDIKTIFTDQDIETKCIQAIFHNSDLFKKEREYLRQIVIRDIRFI